MICEAWGLSEFARQTSQLPDEMGDVNLPK